ncbi:AMP-dependent synthetase and ligase family protein [Artemisia annua]|uniref:AMP-dependent synthetase and ligase family protein n=1 Tax=Artemisia annua TaxID=35608 RepID=A0A2U1PEC8_ARTAN|nr:AMP-dependent synthetase and ligase family protein [Artemisia annua]
MANREDLDIDDDFSDLYKEYTGPPRTVTTVVSDATNTNKRYHASSDDDQEARDPNAVSTDFTSQEAKVWEANSKATERIWKKRKEEELICKICGEIGSLYSGIRFSVLNVPLWFILEVVGRFNTGSGCPSTLGANRKSQDFIERVPARDPQVRRPLMVMMVLGVGQHIPSLLLECSPPYTSVCLDHMMVTAIAGIKDGKLTNVVLICDQSECMESEQWEEFLQVDAQRRQQRVRQPMAASGLGGYKQVSYSECDNTNPCASNNMPMDLRLRPRTRLGMIGETLIKTPIWSMEVNGFESSVEKYPNNKMLGWRELDNGKWGPYIWKTYKTVYEEVLNVAYAIMASGLQPGCKVGIYGANCPQWIVAMEACNAQSLICVPLYDTLGAGAVNFILEHAEIDIVFVQDKKVGKLLDPECIHTRRLKTIVCFTAMEDEEKEKVDSFGIKSFSWNEFLHMGSEHPSELQTPQATDICMIMYTSGTNGDPKGVILTHENAITNISGIDIHMEQYEDKMTVDDVYLSFLPLAHILDRIIEEYFFRKGASVGFYHGDINAIRDDIMELKPTFLAGVPRVLERIYEGVLKGLEELNPRRRKIFDILYNYKLKWMKSGYKHKYASPFADMLAFKKIKNKLGGRIRCIVSGGAPLSPEVEEFLRVTSCAFVVQGYGLTETCGLAAVAFPDEMCMVGTVGNPFVYLEIRLEEVPEMGYDPLAYPSRGEICLRGRTPFAGYYKNPELTNEVMRDGWFHTGDIGEMLPNGSLKIIDRKKHLIKLSQGEYVALEHLEKVYGITPIVEDIWVYGDSFKSSLVAVVVPNQEQAEKWADKNGHTSSFSDLCTLTQLRDYILCELKSTAERNKLRGFEQIKGVIVEAETFEGEKGLLTATLKKKRDKMLNYYKIQIDNLYTNIGGNKS